jgi:pyruvate ferredoxin oxidoreductase beta subunit
MDILMAKIKKEKKAEVFMPEMKGAAGDNEEFFTAGHNACSGCGAAIAMRHIANTIGKNSIVSIATGCMEVVSTPYPYSAWKIPCIHSAFANAAATASGIELALKQQGKKGINVVAIAGDGGTFDIGLQALSGAIERQQKILFICYDNEAYENTGIQRSGATPVRAETTTTPYGTLIHGKTEWKKNMPMIIASHDENVYVATANIAYLGDFENKIKKALNFNGPSYIQVYTPCIPGWKIPENSTIEVSRLAVQSKIWPLYEIENGIVKLNVDIPNPKPLKNYLRMQGRFSKLSEKEIEEMQNRVNQKYDKLKELNGKKLFF